MVIGVLLPAAALVTAALSAIIYSGGSVLAGYAVLVVGWLPAAPLAFGPRAPQTRIIWTTLILLTCYMFFSSFSLAATGALYGLPAGKVAGEACAYVDKNPAGSLAQLAEVVCERAGGNLSATSACELWPSDLVRNNTRLSYLDSWFAGEQLCVTYNAQSHVYIISVTPGSWVLRFMWTQPTAGEASQLSSMVVAILVLVACMLLAFVVIPPQLLMRTWVRESLFRELRACAGQVRSLRGSSADLSVFALAQQTRLIDGITRATGFVAFEPHLDEVGPRVAYWPQLRPVCQGISKLREAILYAAVVAEENHRVAAARPGVGNPEASQTPAQIQTQTQTQRADLPPQEQEELAQAETAQSSAHSAAMTTTEQPVAVLSVPVQRSARSLAALEVAEQLTLALADCVALRPGSGACEEFQRERVQGLSNKLAMDLVIHLQLEPGAGAGAGADPVPAAPAASPSEYAQVRVDPDLMEVAIIAHGLFTLKAEVDLLLVMKSTPSWKGLLTTVLGACGSFLLFYVALAESAASLCAKNKQGPVPPAQKQEQSRDNGSRRRWRQMWGPSTSYSVRLVLASAGLTAVVLFAPGVNNYLLYPVGATPWSGVIGGWVILPVTTCTGFTTEGTTRMTHMRLLGTGVGALLGWISALAVYSSVAGGAVLVAVLATLCVFVGANEDKSPLSYFRYSDGYHYQLASWTVVVIALDSFSTCSKPGDSSSLCKYTVGQIAALRVIAMLVGVGIVFIVAVLVLPVSGATASREELAEAAHTCADAVEAGEATQIAAATAPRIAAAQDLFKPTTLFSELPLPLLAADLAIPRLTDLVQELCPLAAALAMTRARGRKQDAQISQEEQQQLEEVVDRAEALLRAVASCVAECYHHSAAGRRRTSCRHYNMCGKLTDDWGAALLELDQALAGLQPVAQVDPAKVLGWEHPLRHARIASRRLLFSVAREDRDLRGLNSERTAPAAQAVSIPRKGNSK